MFTISHDHYAILGVPPNATPKQIHEAYIKIVKEAGLDNLIGLLNKTSDEDIKKVIQAQIDQKTEEMKDVNEANEVLSDPIKRKQYDDQVFEPKVEEPRISVSPKTISFGTLNEGQKKSSAFTIENSGGPAASVNIDWEGEKPDWGGMVFEETAGTFFPVKVTVSVDTTGIPSGVKSDKILITVDGKVQTVEVFLSVAKAVVPLTPAPVPGPVTPVPVLGPTSGGWVGITATDVWILLMLLLMIPAGFGLLFIVPLLLGVH